MKASDLDSYLSLEAAHRHLGQPDVSRSVLAARFDAGDRAELDRLNRSLEQLVGVQKLTHAALDEQLQHLFSHQEDRFKQAMIELVGMCVMSSDRVLRGVRWPAHNAGSAPFDALAGINSVDIPVDIKTASESGLLVLRERLDRVIDEWANQNHIGPVQYELDVKNDLTQAVVGEMMNLRLLDMVKNLLAQNTFLPVGPLQITSAGRSFALNVTRANLVSVDLTSPERDERVRRMAAVIANHACDKSAKHATHLDTAKTGFVLLYVQIATAGIGDVGGPTSVMR